MKDKENKRKDAESKVSFKDKMKELKAKLTPGFVKEYKAKQEAMVASVDLAALSKPVNDVETSGPKKMKDFSIWPGWKTFLVGVGGVLFVVAVWWIYAAVTEAAGKTSFLSSPPEVINAFINQAILSNNLWRHLGASLQRIVVGYLIALVASIPVAFLMAWYKPVRAFFDPFIQFLRCVPPIAYVPVVVALFGTNEQSKYFIIFLAVFLTMTVTIYQGVKNVDLTLVKAAYTFGAKDRNLFLGVVVPNAFPFILTAMRLGVGAAMTTLVAAELTGTAIGLGAFIQNQGGNLIMNNCIMGILVLGIFGIVFDKGLLFLEKRLTRWK